MTDSGNFSDQVVVVTGAAGALGQAVVDAFADSGATVAQLDVLQLNNTNYSVSYTHLPLPTIYSV